MSDHWALTQWDLGRSKPPKPSACGVAVPGVGIGALGREIGLVPFWPGVVIGAGGPSGVDEHAANKATIIAKAHSAGRVRPG